MFKPSSEICYLCERPVGEDWIQKIKTFCGICGEKLEFNTDSQRLEILPR